MEQNPARLLKVPPKVVQMLTQDQIRHLLAAIDLTKPNGFRDRCIALLFLDTGMRLSGLAHLETSKVDLRRGNLYIPLFQMEITNPQSRQLGGPE